MIYIKANCGNTYRSSGTGYLDDYGNLVAVHRGQSQFLYELSNIITDLPYFDDDFDNFEAYSPHKFTREGFNASIKYMLGNDNLKFEEEKVKSLQHNASIENMIFNPNSSYSRNYYKNFEFYHKYYNKHVLTESVNPIS